MAGGAWAMKLKNNQILLTFKDQGTADYVKLICRRKGYDLESYILDNFEWDDLLHCQSDLNEGEPITAIICDGCNFSDKCPDVVSERGL
jgi:hypothetical protein